MAQNNLKVIAPVHSRLTFPSYSQDRSTWKIVCIPSTPGKKIHVLTAIETWNTSKTDQSDAGTFSFSGPLADPDNLAYLIDASPMDIVAIYASRASDGTPSDASVDLNLPTIGPGSSVPSGWGASSGAQTRALFSPSLVFLGVVDDPHENYLINENGRAVLTVSGRDFTKFLIENDIVMPFSVGSTEAYVNARTAALGTTKSISQLMYSVLDTFVARTQDSGLSAGEAAAYSFPWRNFIRTDAQDSRKPYYPFNTGSSQVYPPYQIQSGSAWANLIELKNEPLARLMITEDGQFLVDDELAAITTQTPISFKIGQNEVCENIDLSQDDGNVATFITLYSALTQQGANYGGFGGIGIGNKFNQGGATPKTTNAASIQKFGIRQLQFQALYDTFTQSFSTAQQATIDEPARQRFLKLLQLLHNQLDVMNLTVKGRAHYRVGTRVRVGLALARSQVSNAVWYITNVDHEASFEGWTTKLVLRWPQES